MAGPDLDQGHQLLQARHGVVDVDGLDGAHGYLLVAKVALDELVASTRKELFDAMLDRSCDGSSCE